MATASVVNSPPTTDSIQNKNLPMSSSDTTAIKRQTTSENGSSAPSCTNNGTAIASIVSSSTTNSISNKETLLTNENKAPINKEVATKQPLNSFIFSAHNKDAADLVSSSNQVIHQPTSNTLCSNNNAVVPNDQIHVNDPLRQNGNCNNTASNVPSIINTSKVLVTSSINNGNNKIVSGQESINALQATLRHHNVVGTVTHHFHPGTIQAMPGLPPQYSCIPHLGPTAYATQTKSKSDLFFSNMRLRRGKWTLEEENYANHLIAEFEKGTLADCENGSTLRSYLAQKLHCAPMRISKKYAGKSIGKHVFLSRTRGKAAQSHQIDRSRLELENRFLRSLEEETNASLGQHEQIQKGMIFGGHPPNPLALPRPGNNFGATATPPIFQNSAPPPQPQSNPHNTFSGMMLSFPSYQQGQWNQHPYPPSLSSSASACSSISHPTFDLTARQKSNHNTSATIEKFTPPPININPALFPNNQTSMNHNDVVPGKIIFNCNNGMKIMNETSHNSGKQNSNGTNHTIYHQKLVNTVGNIVPGTILFSTNNGVKAIQQQESSTPSSSSEPNLKNPYESFLPDVLSTGDSYAPLSSPTYNIDDKYQSETFTTCSFDEYHKFLGSEFPGMYNSSPEIKAKQQQHVNNQDLQPQQQIPPQNSTTAIGGQSTPHPHIPFPPVNSVTSDVYAHFAQQSMLAVSQHSAYCRNGMFKPNESHLIAPEKALQHKSNENAQQSSCVDKTLSSSSLINSNNSAKNNSNNNNSDTSSGDSDERHNRSHKRMRPSSDVSCPTNNNRNDYMPSSILSKSTCLAEVNANRVAVISGSERSNSDRESVRGSSRASSENSGTDSTTGSENASDNDGSDAPDSCEEQDSSSSGNLSPKRAKMTASSSSSNNNSSKLEIDAAAATTRENQQQRPEQ